ncbi:MULTISPECIES: peptidylprolyl isomerase [Caballeronia]|uniref:Periplasmic chaperone PpiD n=1 Tax=Caballeronia cordobensis TaxID=1353886 RepID=A0A158JJM5_CABCO|nr:MULTISPECIES: SurA N-terminal domain-containing protein [Caballeronia]MCE4541901.1 SurA N-terminal domain-containing protein [Caballeronia sp. PC1]MCE4569054.1 SurA N-terminal domain-containing protein [Caballeronia sp. CLC5]BAO86315.1 PpiC-type peptidyl-prolyl cis-trans isomerase [Burkholderia sp. RPE67]SAL68669.1 PpiC-type peptidyl-prolyl cis-trans isomerase [Caballeronia cordobensis]
MLDFFRNHQRLMMALLILIIVPGLGMVGIQGFSNYFDESSYVASVNGHKITRAEFDSAFRQQVDRARSMLGAQFDAKMFDTPETRAAMVDSLVQQRAMADETQRLHLTASDDAVRRALMTDPVISSLKKPDGSIDLDRYKQLLAMQGMTPEQYDERMRYTLATEQIPGSIQGSSFTSKSLAQSLTELAEQKRSVQGLSLRTADYAAKIQPTDAQLTAFYEAHRNEFATPETATIQYLVLSPSTIAAASKPSDADLKKYYDDNIQRYRTEAEVRASHILVNAPKDASAADKAKAKQKAEELLAQVKAHPDQFAQIAQKNSEDPGSANKGGDLGYFARGQIAGGKAFDDAAFGLKKGEVSNIVESDFGYHIIEATDVKPSITKPFDEVKDALAKDYTAQQGTKGFADAAQGFTDLVYEKAKSLQPAADKYKLAIQTATVGPKPNPQLPQDNPLNNPKLLAAIFAPDSVKDRNNTQAIDVGNNTLIAARVTDYKASSVPAFDVVKDEVRKKVVADLAAAMAKKEGEAKLAELQKSKSADGFTSPVTVSRNDAQGLPPAALSAIFKADASKLPAYVGVDLGADGYAIYRVNGIDKATPVAADRLAGAQQQVAQVYAQAEMEAYLSSLKARSKVKLSQSPPPTSN